MSRWTILFFPLWFEWISTYNFYCKIHNKRLGKIASLSNILKLIKCRIFIQSHPVIPRIRIEGLFMLSYPVISRITFYTKLNCCNKLLGHFIFCRYEHFLVSRSYIEFCFLFLSLQIHKLVFE